MAQFWGFFRAHEQINGPLMASQHHTSHLLPALDLHILSGATKEDPKIIFT